jgi:hypothetical protein
MFASHMLTDKGSGSQYIGNFDIVNLLCSIQEINFFTTSNVVATIMVLVTMTTIVNV